MSNQSSCKNIAVFIDRDGTISEEVGYLNHIDRLKLISGVPAAIKLLNKNGLKVIVVTNQAGVAKGYFPEELILKVHERLKKLLSESDAHLDEIYYCPHHPDSKDDRYGKICSCRKPEPGMIKMAADDFDIDIKKSYVVGDKLSDVSLAHRVGAKGILVLTGYGKGEIEHWKDKWKKSPEYIAKNLHDAVKWILSDSKKSAQK